MRPDWQVAPLGKFIKQSKKKVKVQDGFEYPAVGVMMEGRGFVTRPPFVGGITTYKQLTPIEPNQLVLRSITAWEAPIQVTTQAQLGFHVSGVFPVFDIDSSILNPRFLSLLCRYEPFWESMRERTVGSVLRRKTLSATALMEIPIQLPPLPEQKRIVDLISSVDSYIEALQQQLESAKKSRNAVLHELMTARGNDWVVRKLPEVVEVLDRMRKPINSTEREDRKGNIPYYGANGQTGWIDEFIFNEELVLLGEDAIDFADPSARKAYLIQGPSWVNNHAHVLRADKTIVNSYFLMESLNKVDYSQYVSFGTRSKLTQASMNGIKLLIPPMNIQEKFVDLLENFDKVIEATQRSIEDSKELRTGMLSNLLSGEHEIPTSYDKFIGAA
jgi:type I restriction enzyme S subunit